MAALGWCHCDAIAPPAPLLTGYACTACAGLGPPTSTFPTSLRRLQPVPPMVSWTNLPAQLRGRSRPRLGRGRLRLRDQPGELPSDTGENRLSIMCHEPRLTHLRFAPRGWSESWKASRSTDQARWASGRPHGQVRLVSRRAPRTAVCWRGRPLRNGTRRALNNDARG